MSRDGEDDEPATERLTITPHPLRSYALGLSSSPETPHSNSRQLPESKQLLPQSSKSLFQYSSTTTNLDLKEVENGDFGSPFPKWNNEPQTLQLTKSERLRDALFDILVISLTLPFIALAATMIRIRGKVPEGNQEEALKQSIYTVSAPSALY